MSTTTLRLRTLPRYPARISGTNGVVTERPAGSADLIVKNDFSDMIRVPAVDNPDKIFLLTWNSDQNFYSIMSFTDTFAAAIDVTGLMSTAVYDPANHAADAFARANHTGVQAISTITGLLAALGVYAAKSGNYTAVLADNNAEHRFTAAATVSLTAAATLGANWHYTVIADGGDVTIDPNGSETINGQLTLLVPIGTTAKIICDGTSFFVVYQPDAWATVFDGTVTSVTSFVRQNLVSFSELRIRYKLTPDTVASSLLMQLSTDNGSTWISGATDYAIEYGYAATPNNPSAVGGLIQTAGIQLTLGNPTLAATGANAGAAGKVDLSDFNKARLLTISQLFGYHPSTGLLSGNGFGFGNSSTARNALRITCPNAFSGSITIEAKKG